MKNNHVAILLEDIEGKLSRFAEAMADVPGTVEKIDERLKKVESDLQVIKAVVTDHNQELRDHASRISTLETT